jgi:hypothetical protein
VARPRAAQADGSIITAIYALHALAWLLLDHDLLGTRRMQIKPTSTQPVSGLIEQPAQVVILYQE